MRALFFLALLAPVFVAAHTYGDICDAVRSWNIPCVHMNATTVDGFVLDVLRLPNPKGYPVVMQHGLIMTADTYTANSDPSMNFAAIMHQRGYDVYLPNSRGNHYSQTNLKYPVHNESDYWVRVDCDEMAAYDVPAVIDLVLNTTTTNATKVTWVGHSEGTFMIFAGLSTSARHYADKINLFIALAPVAYVGHVTSPLFQLLAPAGKTVEDIALALGIDSVFENDWLTHLVGDLCPLGGDLCPEVLSFVFGPSNYSNFASNLYPTVTKYTPGGTSMSNIAHWAQMVHRDVFGMHDFGAKMNMEFYGTPTAPVYNLSAFPTTVPTVLVSGTTDALADPTDVARMVAELPAAAVVEHIVIPDYGHMDFVWGMDAKTRLYPQLAAYIDKYWGAKRQ